MHRKTRTIEDSSTNADTRGSGVDAGTDINDYVLTKYRKSSPSLSKWLCATATEIQHVPHLVTVWFGSDESPSLQRTCVDMYANIREGSCFTREYTIRGSTRLMM